jgi:hypothetical protein
LLVMSRCARNRARRRPPQAQQRTLSHLPWAGVSGRPSRNDRGTYASRR